MIHRSSAAFPEVDGQLLTTVGPTISPADLNSGARLRRIIFSSCSDSNSEGVHDKPVALARHGNPDVDDVIEMSGSLYEDAGGPKPLVSHLGFVLVPLLPSTIE